MPQKISYGTSLVESPDVRVCHEHHQPDFLRANSYDAVARVVCGLCRQSGAAMCLFLSDLAGGWPAFGNSALKVAFLPRYFTLILIAAQSRVERPWYRRSKR